MAKPKEIDLQHNMEDSFVAFLDVMGFSNLVNKGNLENLESYFSRITEVLDKLREDKADIKSFLISDSIILIAPGDKRGFIQLLWAIRRIQSALLWRKILLRGAVSRGQVYYNPARNIIVGKGFIKAYLLEQEAIFPRVIIDPAIIKFLADDKADFIQTINKSTEYNFEDRLVYTRSEFSALSDDGIFIDYANKSVLQESINGNLKTVYAFIIENLYSEQKLYAKYVWLRDYFLEILKLTQARIKSEKIPVTKDHLKEIAEWISKFERL